MTPAEFWARVQPSGLTAEQELLAFWQRMLDCPCKNKAGGGGSLPTNVQRRVTRQRRRDTDDDVLLFLLR